MGPLSTLFSNPLLTPPFDSTSQKLFWSSFRRLWKDVHPDQKSMVFCGSPRRLHLSAPRRCNTHPSQRCTSQILRIEVQLPYFVRRTVIAVIAPPVSASASDFLISPLASHGQLESVTWCEKSSSAPNHSDSWPTPHHVMPKTLAAKGRGRHVMWKLRPKICISEHCFQPEKIASRDGFHLLSSGLLSPRWWPVHKVLEQRKIYQ